MSLALAGLGASVVGNVVGGIQTAKINKQRQNNLNNEKAYSENLFNKQYYEDVMKRSENQSFLRQLQRNQDEPKEVGPNSSYYGATPEATAAQAKNDSQIYADAVNKLVSVASQRKDQALADYNRRRGQLFGMQDNVDQERAAAWGNFMQNASTLGNAALSKTAGPLDNNLQNTDYSGNSTATTIKAMRLDDGLGKISTPQQGVTVTGGPVKPTKLPYNAYRRRNNRSSRSKIQLRQVQQPVQQTDGRNQLNLSNYSLNPEVGQPVNACNSGANYINTPLADEHSLQILGNNQVHFLQKDKRTPQQTASIAKFLKHRDKIPKTA